MYNYFLGSGADPYDNKTDPSQQFLAKGHSLMIHVHVHYRQVTRQKSKSSAVVKHQKDVCDS